MASGGWSFPFLDLFFLYLWDPLCVKGGEEGTHWSSVTGEMETSGKEVPCPGQQVDLAKSVCPLLMLTLQSQQM